MLRVLLAGPPRADRADPWVRFAADGRPLAHGQDVPARWPDDTATEAVLAADQVRLVALALPPLPRNRLRSAARYALEDQLATTADEAAIAVAAQRAGRALAAVASQALLRSITAHGRRIGRIIPEPALAPHTDGWTWCASAAGTTFIRRADGSAFATGDGPGPGDDLAPELTAALAQAARAGSAPAAVHVAMRCDSAQLARWSKASGVPFVAAPAWQWDRATPATFAAAPDFLAGDERSDAASKPWTAARAFRPALLLAAAALIVHVGALAAQWTSLSVENRRLAGALIDEAAAAQLQDATTPAAAAAAIARRNADARHRAGRSAPADALPLLARAASSIGALPPGALRSAHYTDGAWTLELGKLDAQSLSRIARLLAAAGIDAVAAPTAAGTRMRLALAATAR
ncbi:MAG TPA: type II secretion system protein GspL [Casimicrobiaceae bacterium]